MLSLPARSAIVRPNASTRCTPRPESARRCALRRRSCSASGGNVQHERSCAALRRALRQPERCRRQLLARSACAAGSLAASCAAARCEIASVSSSAARTCGKRDAAAQAGDDRSSSLRMREAAGQRIPPNGMSHTPKIQRGPDRHHGLHHATQRGWSIPMTYIIRAAFFALSLVTIPPVANAT